MFKEEELMDIIRFKAGFGNQMFQYAFLLELQERGRNVKGYLGFYDNSNIKYMLQEVFPNINIEMVDDQIFRKRKEDYDKIFHSRIKYRVYKYIKRARKYWMEESDGKYDANVFKTKNCVFVGYWETEKYFSHVKDKVRQAYQFPYGEDKLQKLAQELKNKNSVSIHVRRGDYLTEENERIFGNICTIDYYKNAMRKIEESISNPYYVVFSNDIEWTKKNLKIENGIYISGDMFTSYMDWYDMYLMSQCRHNIVANSSFSWWAAWLNENKSKVVVSPGKWLNTSDTRDIWAEGWIKIPV